MTKREETSAGRYIQRRVTSGGVSYRVRLSQRYDGSRYLGTFDTLENAKSARDQFLAVHEADDGERPEIDGLTADAPEQLYTADELWADAEKAQARSEAIAAKRARQRIVIPKPSQPFALAYLSDMHIGNAGTDYTAIRHDAEVIASTPRLWCGYHGDGVDNWIVGKLAGLQRDQALPFDAEVQLFTTWIEKVGPKLLWAVAGNHDNWTRKLSGFDRVREALRGVRVLYDPHEVVFTLEAGQRRIVYKVRHKWRYGSVFNVTHGIEAGWQRGDSDFDVGLGGHTHIGTVCRPFFRHRRERQAVLIGTYHVRGEYGRELGLRSPVHSGCGAHVFWDDTSLFCHDLDTAATFLKYLLKRAKKRRK